MHGLNKAMDLTDIVLGSFKYMFRDIDYNTISEKGLSVRIDSASHTLREDVCGGILKNKELDEMAVTVIRMAISVETLVLKGEIAKGGVTGVKEYLDNAPNLDNNAIIGGV